ncbi:MAG: ribbon-helix-helix protein, CopG family [Halobacteriaceae archaeon]
MQTFPVPLDDETADEVARLAREHDASRQEVLRQLVELGVRELNSNSDSSARGRSRR